MGIDEETDFLDHDALDWAAVTAAVYQVDQRFRYEYATPVHDLRHRLVIAPPSRHGDQRRRAHRLRVSPELPAVQAGDQFGNEVFTIAAPRIEREVEFTFRSLVTRAQHGSDHAVAPALLDDPALRTPRPLTTPDADLLDAAADLRRRFRDPRELAAAINTFVDRELTYAKNVTDVFTTAAVAFRLRRGVCQDYAHVMLALARASGLAARYVSGHMLGEGSTHAWVEVIVPQGSGAVALSFDPTQGTATTLRYLVVAVGRDYEDVAPTSGSFVGNCAGSLTCEQSVRIAGVTLAA